jgi:hypothetical protein
VALLIFWVKRFILTLPEKQKNRKAPVPKEGHWIIYFN